MANNVKLLPDRVVTDYSLDTVRAHTFQVALLVLNRWPVFFPWGEGGTGDHHAGKALDFPTYEFGSGVNRPGALRVAMGQEIADYLWSNRKTLGVRYVIYRRHIISVNSNNYGPAGRWNPMEDRGNPTKNHMDHVHVSFLEKPPAYTYRPAQPKPTPPPEVDDMPTADEIARALLEVRIGPNDRPVEEYIVGIRNKLDQMTREERTEDAAEGVSLASLASKLDQLLSKDGPS